MSTWRYIAQNILTGQFLHWDLPLKRDELSWELSGPGALQATFDPEIAGFKKGVVDLQEWSTAIYAEAHDQIRWGGIIHNADFSGSTWKIECAGFTSYPNGIPYTGTYYHKINWDPTDIFAAIWTHLQTQPDGNLGVEVVVPSNCPVRIGTADEQYALSWWEAPDCGSELASLATETPFDYVEDHYWKPDNTIGHRVTVGYPRIGRKRTDLAFVAGSNIISLVPVRRDGDRYANIVYGLGKGEGSAMVRGEVALRDGRLRRPYVYTDKSANTTARIQAGCRKQFASRSLVPAVSSITVLNHPNARIGSWIVGDDILVQADLPWIGEIAIWHRVVSWSLLSDSTAVLSLARSDTFSYGGTS